MKDCTFRSYSSLTVLAVISSSAFRAVTCSSFFWSLVISLCLIVTNCLYFLFSSLISVIFCSLVSFFFSILNKLNYLSILKNNLLGRPSFSYKSRSQVLTSQLFVKIACIGIHISNLQGCLVPCFLFLFSLSSFFYFS